MTLKALARETSPLTCRNGTMRVPTGAGFGIEIDPQFVSQAGEGGQTVEG
jgi:hypothetical protein